MSLIFPLIGIVLLIKAKTFEQHKIKVIEFCKKEVKCFHDSECHLETILFSIYVILAHKN